MLRTEPAFSERSHFGMYSISLAKFKKGLFAERNLQNYLLFCFFSHLSKIQAAQLQLEAAPQPWFQPNTGQLAREFHPGLTHPPAHFSPGHQRQGQHRSEVPTYGKSASNGDGGVTLKHRHTLEWSVRELWAPGWRAQRAAPRSAGFLSCWGSSTCKGLIFTILCSDSSCMAHWRTCLLEQYKAQNYWMHLKPSDRPLGWSLHCSQSALCSYLQILRIKGAKCRWKMGVSDTG